MLTAALPRRKVDFEIYALRGTMAVAGCLVVAGALGHNPGTVLISLAACLVTMTRIERNYRRGLYDPVKAETLE